MLREVDTPEATAINRAEINKAKKERLARVSLSSLKVFCIEKPVLGGGFLRLGICL